MREVSFSSPPIMEFVQSYNGKNEQTILILSELVIFRGLQERNINDKNSIESKKEFLFFKVYLKQICNLENVFFEFKMWQG